MRIKGTTMVDPNGVNLLRMKLDFNRYYIESVNGSDNERKNGGSLKSRRAATA